MNPDFIVTGKPEPELNRASRRRSAAILRAKPIAKQNRKRKGIRKPHWESRAVVPVSRVGWDVRRLNWLYPVGPGSIKGDPSCEKRRAVLWTVMLSPAEVERRQGRTEKEAA